MASTPSASIAIIFCRRLSIQPGGTVRPLIASMTGGMSDSRRPTNSRMLSAGEIGHPSAVSSAATRWLDDPSLSISTTVAVEDDEAKRLRRHTVSIAAGAAARAWGQSRAPGGRSAPRPNCTGRTPVLRGTDQIRQCLDERGVGILRRRAEIAGQALFDREIPVFHVQLPPGSRNARTRRRSGRQGRQPCRGMLPRSPVRCSVRAISAEWRATGSRRSSQARRSPGSARRRRPCVRSEPGKDRPVLQWFRAGHAPKTAPAASPYRPVPPVPHHKPGARRPPSRRHSPDPNGSSTASSPEPRARPAPRPRARPSASCLSWSSNTADRSGSSRISSGPHALTARATGSLKGCQYRIAMKQRASNSGNAASSARACSSVSPSSGEPPPSSA